MRIAFLTGFLLVWLPLALFAQDGPVTPGGELRTLVLLGSTWLAGYLSERAYNGLKTIWPWWDNRPAVYHQLAAPVVGFAFGVAAAGFTAAEVLDLHGPASALVGGLANALIMAGVFRAEKAKAAQ